MSRHGPWRVLGIDPTDDFGAIRRAYAARLRALDVDNEVDAFARLRAARDHALRLAKSLSAAAELVQPELESPSRALAQDHLPPAAQADAGPPQEDGPREPVPPEILLAILFPEGEQSDAPLDHDEWQQASAAVAAITARAQESSIDEQRAIDEWLAHNLALAWPRSAHLVAAAADGLGWGEESGQISEQPARRFLNLRLRGMRFVEMVNDPKHRLHRAWKELSREGRKTVFSFLRARRSDVATLLDGIRERYPEVESHLDPVRVASWESERHAAVGRLGAWIFGVVFLIAARTAVSIYGGDDPTHPPPVELPAEASAEADRAVASLVADMFGDAEAAKRLPELAPELNYKVESFRKQVIYDPAQGGAYRMQVLNTLRLRAQLAGQWAGFEDLVAIRQVELDLLSLPGVRDKPSLCEEVTSGNFIDEAIPADDALRARERKLYARLLEQGLLTQVDRKGPTQARIPGALIEEVLRTTGLSREAFELAAQRRAGSVDQCRYTRALLAAVLRRPGKAPEDLLRIL